MNEPRELPADRYVDRRDTEDDLLGSDTYEPVRADDVDPRSLPRPEGYALPSERPRGAGASLMIAGMCVVAAVVLSWTWWSTLEQPQTWTSGLFLWSAAAVALFALGLLFWAVDGVRLLAPLAVLIGIGMLWTTCSDMLTTFAGTASGDLPHGVITAKTTALWGLQLLAGILTIGGATVEIGGPIRR